MTAQTLREFFAHEIERLDEAGSRPPGMAPDDAFADPALDAAMGQAPEEDGYGTPGQVR